MIKLGIFAVLILEIFTIFYGLFMYDKLVSNPDNYYKRIIVEREKQMDSVEIAP